MTLAIVNSLNEKVWREFVDQHPQGNIFHTPEMFHVFERAKGYRPQLWAVVGEGEKILALMMPIQVTLIDGVLHRLTTRSIAYSGCLYSPGQAGEKALAELLGNYTKEAGRETLFTELRNQADMTAVQPVLESCGFTYEDHLDFLIDIDCSSEQVLQNIGARTRKHIRHALRRGNIVVEEIVDSSQLVDWYEVINKTYLAAGVPLADRTLFEAAFEVLQHRGMINFWIARIGSAFVAASVELLYKNKIYGWYGGIDRAYAKEMPGEVLMWRILEWGVRARYKIYDFGGAGKPSERYGVRDFKAKFGGRLVNYGRYTYVHAPFVLAISRVGYDVYSQMIRHLP